MKRAPRMPPRVVPMPPTMIMATNWMDSGRLQVPGSM